MWESESRFHIVSEPWAQRQERLKKTGTGVAEQSLLSSERWLQLHGLKSKKLTLKQILSQIGFPQSEGTVLPDGLSPFETTGLCACFESTSLSGGSACTSHRNTTVTTQDCLTSPVCVYVCGHACVYGVCTHTCMEARGGCHCFRG